MSFKLIRSRALPVLLFFVSFGNACTTRQTPPSKPHENSNEISNVFVNGETIAENVMIDESNLKALSDAILDKNLDENPKLKNTGRAKQLLHRFNEALLKAPVDQRLPILDQYREFALSGCDEKMNGCDNISYLSTDFNSKEILMEIARLFEQKNIETYYRLLMIAYDIQNKSDDPSLDLMYLARANEYLGYLSESGTSAQKGLRNEVLERHKTLIIRILNHRGNLEKDFRFQRFVAEFPFWEYDNSNFETFSSAVWNVVVQRPELLYDYAGGNSTSLRREFQTHISELETINPKSYSNLVKSLDPATLKNLNVKLSTRADEYLYLISQIYQDNLSPEQGYSFWLGTHRDLNRIAELIPQYLAAQFISSLQHANSKMAGYIDSHGPYTADNLVSEFIKASSESNFVWRDFYRRAHSLEQFAQRVYSDATSSRFADFDSLENGFFASFHQSVKSMSVYPQMMVLVYWITQKKFKAEVKDYKIYYADGFPHLFAGKLETLFDYDTGKAPFSSMEVIQSLYYLLAMGTLEAFHIKEEDFLNVVYRTLLDGNATGYEFGKFKADEGSKGLFHYADTLRSKYSNSLNYNLFLQLCRADSQRGFGFSVDLEGIQIHPLLGGLARSIYDTQVTENVGGGFWLDSPKIQDAIESVRTEFDLRVWYLRNISDYYSQILKSRGLTIDEVSKKMSTLEKMLREAHLARTSFLTEITKREEESRECFFKIAQKERDLVITLFEMERAFLEQVHSDMISLKNGKTTDQMLRSKYAITGYGNSYRGFDLITADYFSYHKLDFLIRVKRYLEEGLKTDLKTFPPAAPFIHLAIPPDLSWKSFRDGSEEQKMLINQTGTVVSFDVDKDKFVSQAFKALQINDTSGGQGFTRWIQDFSVIPKFDFTLNTQVPFYKMGTLEVFESGDSSCQDNCKTIERVFPPENLIETDLIGRSFYELKPREAEILKLLGLPYHFTPDRIGPRLFRTFMQKVTDSPWGVFDIPYLLVSQPLLGSYLDLASGDPDQKDRRAERLGILGLAEQYYRLRKVNARAAFEISKFNEDFDRDFAQKVRQEFESIHQFEKLVLTLSETKTFQGKEIPTSIRISRDGPPLETPYLSPYMIEDQRAREQDFHRRTEFFFSMER